MPVKINIILFFSILNLLQNFAFSQQSRIDSLLTVLKTVKEDSSKVNILNDLFLEYEFTDDKKANDCLSKALELSQRINFKKGLSITYIHLGYFEEDKSNFQEALKNYLSAFKINNIIGNKPGIADSHISIGNIYYNLGNYPEALKNYLAALKLYETLGNKRGIAASYDNIGSIYSDQKNYSEALKNHLISLNIYEALGNKIGISYAFNNLGIIYFYQGNYQEALKNHFASLKIKEEIGDISGVANSYNCIGAVYKEQGNYQEALKNFFASLKIKEDLHDKIGTVPCYLNIGEVYTKHKEFKVAEDWIKKSIQVSTEIGYIEDIRDSYQAFSELDSARGNYKGAYENHKLYILYRDSLDNDETRKKTIQSQMTYNFEKKEAATKAQQDKKDAVATADKKRQLLFILFLAALAIAIGIIAVVIFKGLQKSKKAKRIIELQRDEISKQKESVELQKLLVEEHQKEIVDSITYAKRIQYTLLANKQLLEKNLGEHFVLFKPKDIVSGDFYWATEKSWQSTINTKQKINRFYIAACDCTGHGVPGAFMSLLNISFLNEAVNEKNIFEPHKILDHVRKRLIENMDGGQDGMDCILIKIETQTSNIQHPISSITYAAANNSPTIIKNGKLISLEADKMPVGKGEKTTPFTLRTIELEKGDSLYLYSDGYADQFGGPNGKKFKYKQLDELLVSVSNLPAAEQSELLNQRFGDWKGNLEQVDDMLVIGIRI